MIPPESVRVEIVLQILSADDVMHAVYSALT